MRLRMMPALLVLGCGSAAPSDAMLSSGNPASGERVYVQEACADCHGEFGEGGSGGPLGSVHGMSNVDLWDVIYHGTEGMPDYPHLSDQEIADMIAWMRDTVL